MGPQGHVDRFQCDLKSTDNEALKTHVQALHKQRQQRPPQQRNQKQRRRLSLT